MPHARFVRQCLKHDQVVRGLNNVPAGFQKLVAELVMVRAFDEFQAALAGIALRLACGCAYADGAIPMLLATPAASTAGAQTLFESYGRARRRGAKWSRTDFINETTRYVLDPGDTFTSICNANAVVISEMQAVRNRIAHSNAGSRARFGSVVRRHYGASLNSVSPGLLLLSPRFSPILLEQYLSACRIIVRGCARA